MEPIKIRLVEYVLTLSSPASQEITAPENKWPSIQVDREPPTVKITITNSQEQPGSYNLLLEEITQESIENTLIEFMKNNLTKWAN